MRLRRRGRERSAGVVVVRRIESEWRYLLLRAYTHWDFPKGMIETGETVLDAAMREVREETGLTALEFHWGYERRETVPYRRGKIAEYFLAEASRGNVYLPVSPALGRPEHHEFRWLGYPSARSLLKDRLLPIIDWASDTLARSGATPMQ